MTIVVDASAVLAVCKQEVGHEEARRKMRGGFISAVNFSEVMYKAMAIGKQTLAGSIIQTAELAVVSFDRLQASVAADLAVRTQGKGISFADRACLALGIGEGKAVLTGDHRWAELELDIEIDVFRARAN